MFGQLLTIVAVIAASIFTAGALAVGMSASFSTIMSVGASIMTGTGVGATLAVANISGAGLTATAIAAELGAVGIGAIAGAAGSVAGQAVAMASGNQTHFSWEGVGLGAIGGAVGAGMPSAGSAYESVALRAMQNNVLTQGIGVATGQLQKFDWKGVVASAAGAGIGSAAGRAMGIATQGLELDGFTQGVVNGTAAGIAGGVTSALLSGGRISSTQIATDAFGSAIGSSLADQSQSTHTSDTANGQANAFVNAVNGYSQAGPGITYSGEQVAGGERDDHIARILSLSRRADAGSMESLRQPDGTYRVEVSGIGTSPAEPNDLYPGSNLPSIYPDSYVTGRGTTSRGLAYEDWDSGARAAAVRAGEVVRTGMEPHVAGAGAGSISVIGPVHGFFTFNSAGRLARGVGASALDAWLSLPRAVLGASDLARDAVGYTANAISPQRSVLTGQSFGYQPRSGLLRSIQQAGISGTVSAGITGLVRNAPGIGIIGALGTPNRDWAAIGAQAFNTGTAGAGMVAGMRRRSEFGDWGPLTSHPDSHARSVHGGSVTDSALIVRASTGVKPDGSSGPIPPLSSAFYSDDLLLYTDLAIRNNGGLANAVARQPGQSIVRVETHDVGQLGVNLGYGYARLWATGNKAANAAALGPLQRIDGLQSAQGIYEFNSSKNIWETITVYPAAR